MDVRQTCSLIIRVHNPATNLQTSVVRILSNCFYANTQSDIVYRTGSVPSEAIMTQIFTDPVLKYVTPDEWRNTPIDLLEGFFSSQGSDLTQTFPIVVPYAIEHEFTWVTNIATQEQDFIRNTPNATRVRSVQDNRRGSSKSHHILLRSG